MSHEHAFHMVLRPGAGPEYVRLHSPVPKAISDQLAAASITDYAIFLDGDHVFAHFRYEDPEALRSALSYDADPEWTAQVIALTLDRPLDDDLPLIRGLPKVFCFPDRPDPSESA
ncbi:L-rhamnose mutarotase [Pseudonocardia thermophila]|uniref:L-rhamnose mutarotase n=1 Tax=Pseudonocardia thermophila TaxID=1848 RepID=A0A1M6WPG7_PSETH|nr:L-rhamnose mutarotase [Pseudonocardia thermophila]SHK95662.1 L-rhamnose mutarotase [Pseudonocardia thermophila]